jgi:hypothetical protein
VRGDHAHADPVRRVSAGERVDDIQRRRLAKVRGHLLAQPVEVILRQLLVHLAPPDPVLGRRLADDELVLGRAAGVLAGVHDQRAALAEAPVPARERVLVEQRRRRVEVDPPARVDPVLCEIHAAWQFSSGHGTGS